MRMSHYGIVVLLGATILLGFGCTAVQEPVSAATQACIDLGFSNEAIDDLFDTADDLTVDDDAALEAALDDLEQRCVDGCTQAGCIVNCRSCAASPMA